jgi:hypothetical protein
MQLNVNRECLGVKGGWRPLELAYTVNRLQAAAQSSGGVT